MTKEENISTLNEHLEHWKRLLSEKICDQSEGEKTIDALQNAIKVLEQQPTDAVDRVTIKEYLESFGTAYELGKENGLDIALDILDKYTEEWNDKIIRDLPSVTPQPCEDCVSRRAVYEILNDAYFLKIDDGAALQESVKQLPPVTAQPCEDCISRQAVLAIAGDSCLDLDSYEDTREFCDEIKALPPVTPPHPKVGHWISLDTGKPSHLKDGMTTEGVKCSECGEWLIASVEYACYGRYCPNCGSYNGGGE